VVGEHHAHLVAADESLGERERVGDAACLLLVAVEELVDGVVVAVAEQPEELACMCAAGDEHQLVDACADERLDRVRDHRPGVQRGRATQPLSRQPSYYEWIGSTSSRTVSAPIKATIKRNPPPLPSMTTTVGLRGQRSVSGLQGKR